jgi:pimeloyl-ACP methyl ester carboxylesterase
MRALEPTSTGYATNSADCVRSYYEVFGPSEAERTIVFLPTWSLVHSRVWKMQVPYFARRGFRVVTFDGRGNGRSDLPEHGYRTADFTLDTLALFDALGIERAALVALSAGGRWAIQFAAEYPERVSQMVLIAPAARLHGGARLDLEAFLAEPPDREGWNKYNAVHWREEYRDFVEWFVGEIFSEPHSTKPFDDFVSWTESTNGEILTATTVESATPRIAEYCGLVRCPTLIIHGDEDRVIPLDNSRQVQEAIPSSGLAVIGGGGHAPNARDPVRVNLLIHEFLSRRHDRRCREQAGHARA